MKYRIRPFSPLWWFTRSVGVSLILAGCYCWILLGYAYIQF